MKVLLVSEGKHELGTHERQGALEVLVRRLHQNVQQCVPDKVSRNDIHAHHGKGQGYFKKALRWMMEAKKCEYDALILVIDQDTHPERVRELTEAQGEYVLASLPRALGVAILTFDAWMLADEQALTRALGYTVHPQRNPEITRDAKGVCAQLLTDSKGEMSQSELYSAVAGQAAIGTMENRCRKGFAPFAERVRAL
ncbi:MAG: hypothetical protein O7E52_24065 [Candidatus Poribacteria bacterium]|nr:hypothetical protein [Candidatus Poribacteria bacterium]